MPSQSPTQGVPCWHLNEVASGQVKGPVTITQQINIWHKDKKTPRSYRSKNTQKQKNRKIPEERFRNGAKCRGQTVSTLGFPGETPGFWEVCGWAGPSSLMISLTGCNQSWEANSTWYLDSKGRCHHLGEPRQPNGTTRSLLSFIPWAPTVHLLCARDLQYMAVPRLRSAG